MTITMTMRTALTLGVLLVSLSLTVVSEGRAADGGELPPQAPLGPSVPSVLKVELPPLGQPSTSDVVLLPYTLKRLLELEELRSKRLGAQAGLGAPARTFKLSESIEDLALHLDWKNALIRAALGPQGNEGSGSWLVDSDSDGRDELVLRFGGVASLAAKLDFLADLMQYLVSNLLSSEIPLPQSEEGVTLVFNLKGALSALGLDAEAELTGSPSWPFAFSSIEPRALFDVERITITIRSGAVRSEAQLDPADLTLTRGQLEVRFRIGANTITSTTVFARGEGLQQETLVITAQLGSLSLTGQATFSLGLSEFKLEASLAGLLRFSTRLTPEGLREPTLGLQLRF